MQATLQLCRNRRCQRDVALTKAVAPSPPPVVVAVVVAVVVHQRHLSAA